MGCRKPSSFIIIGLAYRLCLLYLKTDIILTQISPFAELIFAVVCFVAVAVISVECCDGLNLIEMQLNKRKLAGGFVFVLVIWYGE